MFVCVGRGVCTLACLCSSCVKRDCPSMHYEPGFHRDIWSALQTGNMKYRHCPHYLSTTVQWTDRCPQLVNLRLHCQVFVEWTVLLLHSFTRVTITAQNWHLKLHWDTKPATGMYIHCIAQSGTKLITQNRYWKWDKHSNPSKDYFST